MGFRLEFEDGEEINALLRRVSATIRDAFPKPFCGYMIFLFTSEDDVLLKQFQKNLLHYDSLTGPTIAFIVFAEKIKIKIHSTGGTASRRSPKSVEFKLQDLADRRMSVSQLIKDGKVGWTAKGDELTAISYATHQVARELNILSLLPCLVVFDALPHEKDFKTFTLSNGFIQNINNVLSQSLDRLHTSPNYKSYKSGIDKISALESVILDLTALTDYNDLKSVENIINRDLTSKSSSIKSSLFGMLSDRPFNLSPDDRITILNEMMLRYNPDLRALARLYATSRNLSAFEQLSWPLSAEQHKALRRIYAKFLHVVGHDITVGMVASDKKALHDRAIAECKLVARSLHDFIIERSTEIILLRIADLHLSITSTRLDLSERCRILQDLSEKIAAETQGLGVSFSDLFAEALGRGERAALVTSSGKILYRFLRPWLQPRTLLSLAKYIGHTGS